MNRYETTTSPNLTDEILGFIEKPSAKGLNVIHLKKLQFHQLQFLIERLALIYTTNDNLKSLYLKCLTRIAKLEIKKGNYDKAKEYLERTLQINPNNEVALNSLGNLEIQRGNYDKAKEYLERTLQINPGDEVALTSLGNLEIQRGNYDKAKEYLERTLQINPSDEVAKILLAKVFIMKGDLHKANSVIVELMQTLSENSNLKILTLSLFYQINPNHQFWTVMKTQLETLKEKIVEISRNNQNMNLLVLNYYQNSLWSRQYGSLPVNRTAFKQMSFDYPK